MGAVRMRLTASIFEAPPQGECAGAREPPAGPPAVPMTGTCPGGPEQASKDAANPNKTGPVLAARILSASGWRAREGFP